MYNFLRIDLKQPQFEQHNDLMTFNLLLQFTNSLSMCFRHVKYGESEVNPRNLCTDTQGISKCLSFKIDRALSCKNHIFQF